MELSVWFIYKPKKLIGGFITEVRERRSQKKQEQRVISFFEKKRRDRVKVVMKEELSGKFERKKNRAFNVSPNIERVKWINEFD